MEPQDLAAFAGAEAEALDRILLTEALIDAYIAVSGDDQAIHRGEEAIAPGNLLLSLVPRMLKSAIEVKNFDSAMTARIDRVAFRRPARIGEKLRLSVKILRVSRVRSEIGRRTAVAVACGLSTDAPIATLRVIDVYDAKAQA